MAIDLPEGYKPSADEEYMSPMQLEYFRRKLLNWRSELLQESENTISHLKEENWQEPDINDRATLETDVIASWLTRSIPRWHALPTAVTVTARKPEKRSVCHASRRARLLR